MYFYNVLVADQRFRGDGPLTYHSDKELHAGTVVTIPLRNRQTVGVITEKASRPSSRVATKAITATVTSKPLPGHVLQLIKWLTVYYPCSSGQAAHLFMPQFLVLKQKLPLKKPADTSEPVSRTIAAPTLTNEQKQAVEKINSTTQSVLLHGATGSGKTRVYVELINQAIEQNKSTVVLTPEIGLTPQLATTLREQFGKRVVVAHSHLTQTQRRTIWLRTLHADEPIVLVGPRSVLFYPLDAIGLLIVDEAHDSSYKQEQMPHYHAARVAGKLSQLLPAQLVLGSATPSVQDYYLFDKKHLPVIRMSRLAKTNQASKVHTSVINTSKREHFNKSPWLADSLVQHIQKTIQQNQQALLYLNRRGTARLVACSDCGWQHTCPQCDSNLIYHGDTHVLRCHTCGSTEKLLSRCPDCGKDDISYSSAGTKLIVEEVHRLFPNAKIARFDSDSSNDDSLEKRYQDLRNGRYDIAVGTRLVGKGLDLPKLSVLGILRADNALLMPDYLAEEELFQEMYQLLGRIGRGHSGIPAHAFIQTEQPNHPTITSALERDYQSFYKSELAKRRRYFLPPYAHLLVIRAKRASRSVAKNSLLKQKEIIEADFPRSIIQGPAPAFKEYALKKYQWKLLVKAKNRNDLVAIAKKLPTTLHFDIDPVRIL